MARLWGRDGSRWTSVTKHWGDIYEHQKYKDEAELHEGKIGVTPMDANQKRNYELRNARKAAKTPLNQDAMYS